METEQNSNTLTPRSYGHQRCVFLVLQGCSTGGPGPSFLLSAGFLYHILSPTGLVSKLTDFLSPPSYIIVPRPLVLVGVTIALIQPIHGQGYNSDIPRSDAPDIYIGAFPILTARLGRRSIYNMMITKILYFLFLLLFQWLTHYFVLLKSITLRIRPVVLSAS